MASDNTQQQRPHPNARPSGRQSNRVTVSSRDSQPYSARPDQRATYQQQAQSQQRMPRQQMPRQQVPQQPRSPREAEAQRVPQQRTYQQQPGAQRMPQQRAPQQRPSQQRAPQQRGMQQDPSQQRSSQSRPSVQQRSGRQRGRQQAPEQRGGRVPQNQDPRQQMPRQQRSPRQQPASQYSRSNYAGVRPADPHRYTVAAKKASNRNRGPKSKLPGLIAAGVVGVIAIAAIVFIFFPPFYNVTINGISYEVKAGTTLKDAIAAGYAAPKPGNMLALDGSVAKSGEGQPFVADVDGTTTSDPNYILWRNAKATITDGGDTVEPYKEQTETIPHGTQAVPSDAGSYFSGSIHIFSDGEDGTQVKRIGDVSGIEVSEVTKSPVNSGYYSYTANVGNEKIVALTFDDGPWPNTTQEVLDILNQNGAHATFFVLGNQVEERSEIVKKLYDAGNEIATHTYDHADGSGKGVNITYMSPQEQIQEVEKGFAAIDNAVGAKVNRVFRAPGGNYYGSAIETLHPYVTAEIGWDVDTEDWRKPGADVIAQRIMSAQPGDIILMHDGGGDRSQTVEALKIALPKMVQQGYKFVTVDELLKFPIPTSANN